MTPILVCPFNLALIGSMRGQNIVVRTEKIEDLPRIASSVHGRNHLHCVWCVTDAALASLELPDGVETIPVALQVNSLGPLPGAMVRIRRLKGRPIRIYFPSHDAGSYLEARLLASLGVHAGIWITPGKIDWDRLDDLLHYAAYGMVDHATIEPFDRVLSKYDPDKRFDPAGAMFDDPCRYLHVSADGDVALSREEFEYGKFIGRVNALEAVLSDPRYEERTWPYGKSFLKFDDCSRCEAWRTCLGRFAAVAGPDFACRKYFSNLVEAAEAFREERKSKIQMWHA